MPKQQKYMPVAVESFSWPTQNTLNGFIKEMIVQVYMPNTKEYTHHAHCPVYVIDIRGNTNVLAPDGVTAPKYINRTSSTPLPLANPVKTLFIVLPIQTQDSKYAAPL